ncbi:hypothetical protein L210DRAFT_3416530, partial [Boletus edulis BED1]
SLLPQLCTYCDTTGLKALYTVPRTTLRYHDTSVYDLIETLYVPVAKDYFSARGVNAIVKYCLETRAASPVSWAGC